MSLAAELLIPLHLLLMFSLVSSLLQEELGLTSVGKERDAY